MCIQEYLDAHNENPKPFIGLSLHQYSESYPSKAKLDKTSIMTTTLAPPLGEHFITLAFNHRHDFPAKYPWPNPCRRADNNVLFLFKEVIESGLFPIRLFRMSRTHHNDLTPTRVFQGIKNNGRRV